MNRLTFQMRAPAIAEQPSGAPLAQPAQRVWTKTWLDRNPIILVALAWTAVGLFQAIPEALASFAWPEFVAKLIDAWAWAILTPAVLFVHRRIAATQTSLVRAALVHLALTVPFSLIHTFLTGLLQFPIPQISWSPLRNTEFATYYYLGGTTTYCAFIGLLQAFDFRNRYLTSQVELERVEKRLLEARLNALRLQLEPHFLFNALNAISSELTAEPQLARQMIEDLGALLRRTLECQDNNEITLAQELALLDRYIAIQKLRFGSRIKFRIDVDPDVLSAMVPPMLLQPLVENAVRHGIEGRMSGGTVSVQAEKAGGQLRIRVVDDGVGLPRRWRMDSSAGLGVRVTRERLEALYSSVGDYGFDVSRRRGGGTTATIHIPLDKIGAAPGGPLA